MTWTHRNKHDGTLCRIAEEENYNGHILYYVEYADEWDMRMVWHRGMFNEHHTEEATRISRILATEEHAL